MTRKLLALEKFGENCINCNELFALIEMGDYGHIEICATGLCSLIK